MAMRPVLISFMIGLTICYHQLFMLKTLLIKSTKLCFDWNCFIYFQVLITVLFFSSIVTLLYYLEVMQALIRFLGRIMEVVMRTSPAESFVAAANIFVGPVSIIVSV